MFSKVRFEILISAACGILIGAGMKELWPKLFLSNVGEETSWALIAIGLLTLGSCLFSNSKEKESLHGE